MRCLSLSLLLVIVLSGCSGARANQAATNPATATLLPTQVETATELPTALPTLAPTRVPTQEPASVPTDAPTEELTEEPTVAPIATSTSTPLPTTTVADTTAPAPTTSGTEQATIAASNTIGDAAHGAELFTKGANGAPPCSTCHLTQVGQTGYSLGPNLAGVSERAGARVEGEDIDAYLHESILEPNAFLVPGYRSIMYPEYGKHYSESEIQDLIAFLKSL